jgi:hypothetical protein
MQLTASLHSGTAALSAMGPKCYPLQNSQGKLDSADKVRMKVHEQVDEKTFRQTTVRKTTWNGTVRF